MLSHYGKLQRTLLKFTTWYKDKNVIQSTKRKQKGIPVREWIRTKTKEGTKGRVVQDVFLRFLSFSLSLCSLDLFYGRHPKTNIKVGTQRGLINSKNEEAKCKVDSLGNHKLLQRQVSDFGEE